MKSIHRIIEEQVRRWEITRKEVQQPEPGISVITISREPGSGRKLVARALADSLGFDLFHQQVINEMAKKADVSESIMKTLDEKKLSMLDDWVSAVISDRHLWPDEYSKLLLKVIGAIGEHGRAVIVGRGANFVIPKEELFRVRVIAPLAFRIRKVSETYDISPENAKRRVLRAESERKAFVRKYFNANITDPANYDIIFNTETISIDDAAATVTRLMQSA